MKTWLITIVAAGVLIALGGFLITRYGDARFDAGYAKAKNDVADAIAATAAEDISEFERIEDETNAMPLPDVDADLVRLGIMRAPDDR